MTIDFKEGFDGDCIISSSIEYFEIICERMVYLYHQSEEKFDINENFGENASSSFWSREETHLEGF